MSSVGFLIGGALIAGVAYFVYKNRNKQQKKISNSLLSDKNRYKGDKNIILKAIEENDWEILEEMLKSKRTQDFPDLIKIIEEALKGRK